MAASDATKKDRNPTGRRSGARESAFSGRWFRANIQGALIPEQPNTQKLISAEGLSILVGGVMTANPESFADDRWSRTHQMKALARSVIEAFLFLELSGDDVVDPDSAVNAMESIAYELGRSSDAERSALREAVSELIELERSASPPLTPRPEVIDFLSSFMESVGLEGE